MINWNYNNPTQEGIYVVMTKTKFGNNLCHLAKFYFDDKDKPRWSFRNQSFICWTTTPNS